jgi:hypothetical protein
MGESMVGETLPDTICVAQDINQSLGFLPAALAEKPGAGPFVAVVKSRNELLCWLGKPLGSPQWIQIEGLLDDPDAWLTSCASQVPLDIVLSSPASEFSRILIAKFIRPFSAAPKSTPVKSYAVASLPKLVVPHASDFPTN